MPAEPLKYRVRRAVLGTGHALGINGLLNRSRWRRGRLSILCYHGFALRDEHLWDPQLFVSPAHFRRRLQYLRDQRFNILPLGEAVRRLQLGELPERAVVITVDDGLYDFAAGAYPLLQEFGFPATVYASTYYVEHPWPVFNVMASYLLWQGARRGATAARIALLGPAPLPIETREARSLAVERLKAETERLALSGAEKTGLLAPLAEGLGLDYFDLLESRVLSLLRPAELRQLDPQVAEFQLHTHRHRTPEDRGLFLREIEDNRAALLRAGRREELVHFCYPSGVHRPAFLPWLREAGIRSATTGEPGLASRASEPLLLPRFVDTELTSLTEFAAGLSGWRDFVSRKTLGL